MSAEISTGNTTYKRLNRSLDAAIGTFGTERVTRYLELMITPVYQGPDAMLRQELVKTFVLTEASHVFGVDSQGLFTGSDEDSRLARRACFYLLVEHLKLSYGQVGKIFNASRQQVYYHITACKDEFELGLRKHPSNYSTPFLKRYGVVQERLLGFLHQISNNIKQTQEDTLQTEIEEALSTPREDILLVGNLPAETAR